MKEHIVIVGAGLGGCFLASGLTSKFHVTMIELSDRLPLLRDCVIDVANPAVTYPNIESGFGGTTKVWHNALMEIDATIFDKKWPFSKSTLAPYYIRAYSALAGVSRENIYKSSEVLRHRLVGMGIPESLLSQNMLIPKVRVNAWKKLFLQDKVSHIEGTVTELIPNQDAVIEKVRVCNKNGEIFCVEADYFVLAAGGLGSPILLQSLSQSLPLDCLNNVGRHYEDHPMAFVGEIELRRPLYKLWNYPIKTSRGGANLRLPLSMYWQGLNISFQLRPEHHHRLTKPRLRIVSLISDIRNFPFRIKNYWLLFTHLSDVTEILSFKFGLRIPTRRYSILMVAEQPPTTYRAIWQEQNNLLINRNWRIDDSYVQVLNEAIVEILKILEPITVKSIIFPNWADEICSSSHHSGTSRISETPTDGVCDINGKVHGVANLYVCDGSIIPSSGFVNTGLTIVALAMRLADFLLGVSSKK